MDHPAVIGRLHDIFVLELGRIRRHSAAQQADTVLAVGDQFGKVMKIFKEVEVRTIQMAVQKRRYIGKRSLLLTTAAILLASTAALSKRVSGERKPVSAATTLSSLPAAEPVAGSVQATSHEFKSMVRVFIHPDDIYPLAATARPGKVVISAENNAGKDIAIVIEPVLNPGHSLGRVAAPIQDKRNKQEFTLAAGEYEFYEESHPKRRGKLIVDPKFR